MDNELFAIQAKLVELGLDPGPVDGVWGKDTRRAIAAHLGITAAAAKKAATLGAVDAPWMALARKQLGTREAAGTPSNPKVVDYFKQASGAAHGDDVPWCAAFVGAMLNETGYIGTGSLMARSYLEWGTKITKPQRGAIVVFKRGAAPAGHVAFVDEWTASTLKCIGGNQSDAVTSQAFSRSGVLGFRWPNEAAA